MLRDPQPRPLTQVQTWLERLQLKKLHRDFTIEPGRIYQNMSSPTDRAEENKQKHRLFHMSASGHSKTTSYPMEKLLTRKVARETAVS